MLSFCKKWLLIGSFFFLIILAGCGSPVSPDPSSMQSYNTATYDADWQQIEQFEQKGLPKSALEVVQKIYGQAKIDNNPRQMVKALIHELKYVSATEEGDLMNRINELEEELKNSQFPVTPMIHSLLAELYQEYYQQNLYRFNGNRRTEDVRELISKAQEHYDSSLENPDKLKTLPVELYDAILKQDRSTDFAEPVRGEIPDRKEINGRQYRPTLYDFLAHRALDFYAQQDVSLIYPSDEMLLQDENYFAPVDKFIALELPLKEEGSFKLRALVLFQDLLSFHVNDSDKSALVDADLKRLAFVHQYFAPDKKDMLYVEGLRKLEQTYAGEPLSGEAKVAIAWHYYNQSQKYDPLQPQSDVQRNDGSAEAIAQNDMLQRHAISTEKVPLYRFDAITANDLCTAVIENFPDSNAALKASYLKSLIEAKELSFVLEEVNLPDQPFRGLVQFRNMEKVYVRVVKVDRNEVEKIQKKYQNRQDYQKALIERYKNAQVQEAFSVDLVDVNDNGASAASDFQRHSAEIKFSALPVGDYLVLAGSDEGLSYEENAVAYAFTSVSRISLVNRNSLEGATEVYVLDRLTGQSLAGAKVQVWQQMYGAFGGEKFEKKESYTADGEGYFNISRKGDSRSFYLEIQTPQLPGDVFVTKSLGEFYGQNIYQYKPYIQQRKWNQAFLFTDRSIYRPGQPLYFKGLLLDLSQNDTVQDSKISPNVPVTITFYDVNNQKIDELSLKTNEFGSFNGSFVTPLKALNGQMRVEVKNLSGEIAGTQYVSVEDYKRPTFEITFDPVEGSYALNDTVKVKGKAAAYAGTPVTDAKVFYKVLRTVRFPEWWLWQKGFYYFPGIFNETQIATGTAITDKDGNFELEFKAIPGSTNIPFASKEVSSISSFKVVADVTDITGETRSGATTVNVSEQEFELSSDIPEKLELQSTQKFTVKALNFNNVAQHIEANVQVIKLESPHEPLRKRLWQTPDIFLFTPEEYRKIFPHDIYEREDDYRTWPQKEVVFETTIRTPTQQELEQNPTPGNLLLSDLQSWKSGTYMIVIQTQDDDGTPVKDVRYVTVYDSLINDTAAPLPFSTSDWFVLKTPVVEPGQEAQFIAGSSGLAKVLYEIEKDGHILQKEWLTFDNNSKRITFPVKEENRGNLTLHLTFIVDNVLYSRSETINVPYTNKELDISFGTFHDKLEPGAQEQWNITIKGKNGEKAAAEFVATLYDASLDALKAHQWFLNLYQPFYSRLHWNSARGFRPVNSSLVALEWNRMIQPVMVSYDFINWFGFINPERLYDAMPLPMGRGAVDLYRERSFATEAPMAAEETTTAESAPLNDQMSGGLDDKKQIEEDKDAGLKEKNKNMPMQPRRNFVETAFFYPDLRTDNEGNLVVSFTLPDSLTRWKMLGFAHTQDLKYGLIEKELVAQKKLMIASNAPRFFREGDTITLMAKVTTLDEALSGSAKLELFDALTMKPLAEVAKNFNVNGIKEVPFKINQGSNASLEWTFEVPSNVQAITYKVSALAGNFTDVEEMTVPVLTNRMLVTETLPLSLRNAQTKTFELQKLINNNSSTLANHRLTLEYTSNPVWYAVQALPYLVEYPYECSEQIFSRFYANSMAQYIIEQHPEIKAIFDRWKNYDTNAFLSNLEKNEELKSVILEETPWVRDASSEEEQKKRIALLFDFNAMQYGLGESLERLEALQLADGSWPWFEGMDGDRYITQHILAGFAHLQKLDVIDVESDPLLKKIAYKAVPYVDRMLEKDFENYRKSESELNQESALNKESSLDGENPFFDPLTIHALYVRSFFLNIPLSPKTEQALQFFKQKLKNSWAQQDNIYLQGMLALAFLRLDEKDTAFEIIASLRERAITTDEMGMYWKSNTGYYWFEAPIERQALLIELFDDASKLVDENEASQYQSMIDDMKIWLLRQKQTQSWPTTKATTEALFALLLRGSNWISTSNTVEITIGDKNITSSADYIEAGTGYLKTSWSGNEISHDMGKVTLQQDKDVLSWGALYWQYFEDLDKITSSDPTALKIDKELLVQDTSSDNPVYLPVEKTALHTGDLIKVRLKIETDRDMEYVHLKDMRAAGLEPLDVLSGCRFQDGLCFYQTTRDTATHFFFSRLPKGKYVIEYFLRVNHEGNFSNGITTIENMYAPEFSGHTKGARIKVQKE